MTSNNLILERNIDSIYPSQNKLLTKLQGEKKLKIYLGIDPTSPEIHIGNAVALWKLREFQDLGHQVTLLIGDFTGMIGDPSDKTSLRKSLTKAQLDQNAKKYKEQASKILNFSGANPAKIEYNSKWLSKMSLEQIIELSANFSVQQLIERDMFQKRLSEHKTIRLHEFIYPILQGYDSVAMEVDIEVGGTDQTFNMLIGRNLLKVLKNKEKFVVTLPLLEGVDGRKMSKSYGNTINITDRPNEMYGKIMSIKDEFIAKYFELCTDFSSDQINKIKSQLNKKSVNPMELKKTLAYEIVKRYHDEKESKIAKEEFKRVFQQGEQTTNLTEVTLSRKILPISIAALAKKVGATPSVSAAIKLAGNKGLKLNGSIVYNPREDLSKLDNSETIIDIGKRRSIKIFWE